MMQLADTCQKRGEVGQITYESEEVGARVIGTTVEVVGGLHAVLRYIGGRVADGNVAVTALFDVPPHITGDGLYVGGADGSAGLLVDDLVTGEEGEGVVVLLEHINGGEDVLEISTVVRGEGVSSVDRVLGSVGVEDEVDASVGEGLHALIVV